MQPNVYPSSPTHVSVSMQLLPLPSPIKSSSFEHPISPPVSGLDVSTDSHTHYQQDSYSRESSSGVGSPPAAGRSTPPNNMIIQQSVHCYTPTMALRSRCRCSLTNDEQDYSDDGAQDGSGVGISRQSTGMSCLILAKTLTNKHGATQREHIYAEKHHRNELNAHVTALEAQVADLSDIYKCLSPTVVCAMGKLPTERYLDVHPPQSCPHGSQTMQTTVL